MQAGRPVWRWGRTLWAILCLAVVLAIGPAMDAVKHGPGAMAAEADHRAYHLEHGHSHDIAGSDRHDPGDHDHVGAALLAPPGAEVAPPPERTLRPGSIVADETIREGPRRPPRVAVARAAAPTGVPIPQLSG
jgi:hypothetical protein